MRMRLLVLGSDIAVPLIGRAEKDSFVRRKI